MTDWTTLTGVDLLVSLRIPRGWEVDAPDEHTLIVQGPAGAALRPTLTIEDGEPEGPGHEWFVGFAAAVPQLLAEQVEGFDLLGVERFRLSSFYADVLMVTARRGGGEAPPTTQVQAYVWVRSDTMYVLGGSTLVENEARDLPVLVEMVRSLRVLPPRTGSA